MVGPNVLEIEKKAQKEKMIKLIFVLNLLVYTVFLISIFSEGDNFVP